MLTDRKSQISLGLGVIAVVFILLSGPLYSQTVPLMLMQIFGLLLIVWAALALKVNKHHLPKGIHHAKTGPYEIIRHPVYTGFLLIISSLVQEHFTLFRVLAFVILIVLVLMRINKEEQLLEEHVKDFPEYKKRTHKLIPYLY